MSGQQQNTKYRPVICHQTVFSWHVCPLALFLCTVMLNYGQQINHSPIVLAVIGLLHPMQRTQMQQCIKGAQQTMLSNHHRIPACIVRDLHRVSELPSLCSYYDWETKCTILVLCKNAFQFHWSYQDGSAVWVSQIKYKSFQIHFFCYHPSATGQQKENPQKNSVCAFRIMFLRRTKTVRLVPHHLH